MPWFALAEEWLHPHLPFTERLVVGFGVAVRFGPIQLGLVEGAQQAPSGVSLGTFGLHGTGITDGGRGVVDNDLTGSIEGRPFSAA